MTTNARRSEHCQTLCPVARSSRTKRLLVIPIALFSFALSGCGPRRVRADFTGYEKSYAITSNQEVLLNLARLAERDPTYFFKLGQISESYRMQAGISGFGQYVPQGASTGVEVPSGGGTPAAIYENDPAFSFIPVSDEANARLVLNPEPEEIFYNLYQQGWRVDQLFRLMVDRIEITLPPDQQHPFCRVEIIPNAPPPSYYAPRDYAQADKMLARYVLFLRISAMVYELQKHGLLRIGGKTTFSALDANSGLTTDPTAKDLVNAAANNEVWEYNDKKWYLGRKSPRPRFELSAVAPDSDVPASEGKYGEHVSDVEDILNNLFTNSTDQGLQEFAGRMGAPELTDVLEILYNGFAIGGSTTSATGETDEDTVKGPCPATAASGDANDSASATTGKGNGRITCSLVMRSLIGLMAAAAQEEEAFDTLAAKNPDVYPELGENGLTCEIHRALKGRLTEDEREEPLDDPAYGLCGSASAPSTSVKLFSQVVPAVERIPVLRLTWPAQIQSAEARTPAQLKDAGLSLRYEGSEFLVTDFKSASGSDASPVQQLSELKNEPWLPENQTWNRDMFRLISELSAQVTVDISKFPLPDILQLRTE